MKRIITFALAALIATSILSGCGASSGIGETGISLAEYERISTNMTYEEVKEIVGGEGTRVSEENNDEDEYIETIVVYSFKGENSGSAEFTFKKKNYKDILKMDFSSPELTSKKQNDLS